MFTRKLLISLLTALSVIFAAKADKGMWLLNELNEQNVERMRELGFNVPLEKLYSLDKPSIANAVVIFGGGCTGITVSNQGLIFTNHHCGYESIQSQSSVNHDYLRDGFVSQSLNEELPIPGLSVKYLSNIVDVTDRINKAVAGIKSEEERINKIEELSDAINAEYSKDKHTLAEVTPYYAGNKYYVVIYKVFNDVRMVFAPPSSVGKFGGDTDNWMWPRHTGDFSVFRVYADANNNPAEYSTSNKPYKPVYFSPVSLQGYKEGEYAMTIGFPGSTDRYLTSWGVEDRMNNENAPRIEVRGAKQEVWQKAMLADQATRIKYASKYAQSANYWKNSIGMNRGIKNLSLVERKREEEAAFTRWVNADGSRKQYANLLADMEKAYKAYGTVNKELNYIFESLLGGTEIVRLTQYVVAAASNTGEAQAHYIKLLDEKYKDYSPEVDRATLPVMLKVLRNNLPAAKLPTVYTEIDAKFGGDYTAYANYVFDKSIVPYESKLKEVLKQGGDKVATALENDPAAALMSSVLGAAMAVQQEYVKHIYDIGKGKREYFAASRLAFPNKQMPSDANFTMRMSYGSIKGYAPQDAAWYNYYTTQRGILQKQDPTSHEFAVQPEILKMVKSGNFGKYADENGDLRIAFLSDNDITGGNSGSPVFDKNGHLIGLAFDGNWEAMSGDLEFEPELQRTISVDIRYVLFMIDKWGNCPRLVKELQLVEGKTMPKSSLKGNKSTAKKAQASKRK